MPLVLDEIELKAVCDDFIAVFQRSGVDDLDPEQRTQLSMNLTGDSGPFNAYRDGFYGRLCDRQAKLLAEIVHRRFPKAWRVSVRTEFGWSETLA